MTEKEAIKHWRSSSKDALTTAAALLKSKRYHHALFFCHLSIEKSLKGLVTYKTKSPPLPIHHLQKLAEYAGLKMEEIMFNDLAEINTFNIMARYDDFRQSFAKKATRKYAMTWFAASKRILKWLDKEY